MKSHTTKSLLLLTLFNFSLIYAHNSCPSSHCGTSNVTVHYPFRFEHEPYYSTPCTYLTLTCNGPQSAVLVNLPNAGAFLVQKIDYVENYIQLYDPRNCLVPRLFDLSLDLSSLLKAILETFTLYVCPRELDMDSIACLSNSTNVTVAVPGSSSPDDRCSAVRSGMIPHDHDDVFFYLTWIPDDCVKCEEGSWGSRAIMKIVAVASTLPALIVLGVSCCSVFCFHMMKMFRERFYGDFAEAAPAPPPSAASSGGMDESKIMGCMELVGISEGNGNSKSCSICLENYCEKETVGVISKCGHCFHPTCVRQWLGKNATCPVCRTSLSDAD